MVGLIRKEKLRKHWYVVPSAIAVVALLAYAYAFTVTWSSSVNIVTTTPNIKVYWDSACTDPVTSIDFGNIQQGAFVEFALYIKNEGGGDVRIYWNSTVSSVTNKIDDCWNRITHGRANFGLYDWNGYLLGGGSVLTTWYMILVDPDIPLNTYSWTLYVGSWAA